MSLQRFVYVVACVASLVSAPMVAAGESEEVRTYRWELTDLLPFEGLGGAFHATLVGPTSGTVVNTRFIVEFVSDDAWDAAGVHFFGFAPIGKDGVPIDITGADFGWSGVGYHTTVYDTDALNGPITFSLWSLHINDFAALYFGHFLKVRIELDVENLVADEACPGDLNGDREITATDLQWLDLGECPAEDSCPGDLDGDGFVTAMDRNILIERFGFVCLVGPDE